MNSEPFPTCFIRPLLDECGLNTAIEWYVSGINQRNGLHVEVEIPQELPRLTEEAELAIFRIVQASLTNVHLHSGASEAKVKIEQNLRWSRRSGQ